MIDGFGMEQSACQLVFRPSIGTAQMDIHGHWYGINPCRLRDDLFSTCKAGNINVARTQTTKITLILSNAITDSHYETTFSDSPF